MLFRRALQGALLLCASFGNVDARAMVGKPGKFVVPYKREALQDIVTWDEHSIFVHGERVMLYSGEFHPFRLPVPSLWLDVFQKIKALGYNCVSYYTDWALHEGKPGDFSAEGIFSYEPFFAAAAEAGIYLIARPGPYINAEVSGGGFPGWLQRVPGVLRTKDASYINATQNYMRNMGEIIAGAQITNGGPVILVQPENEYTSFVEPQEPDQEYFQIVIDQLRDAGITVPLINNEASARGYITTSTPTKVDIYGFDGYPLGFDCANPETWPDEALPLGYGTSHALYGPDSPFSLLEFQGGSFDPWGGWGFEQCGELVNYEFERVFYKNDFSQGVAILNLYMTYGGTNWGNLGHPGGYTSYDYSAVVRENRVVDREKYSEAKLEANFIQASGDAYLTAAYQNNTNANGSYTGNPDLAVTALFGNTTNFFVIRHAAFNSLEDTDYKITLPTSKGNISIPQLGGELSLHGRDSKFHVTDYDLGGINLLYSSAEIFTWKKHGDKTVLIVYGGPNEKHELAVSDGGKAEVIEGSGVHVSEKNGATVLQYSTSPRRRVVRLNNGLDVYLLDRNSAYDYWVVDLPSDDVFGNYTKPSNLPSAPIVRTDYLLRTASIVDDCIHITGDLNATSPVEVIGTTDKIKQFTFNGKDLDFKRTKSGSVVATAKFVKPDYSVPDLAKAEWKVLDTLPEVANSYEDSLWTDADHTSTENSVRNLTTPTSLYSSDYGYHTGILVYRGHFKANGDESSLYLSTQGGSAYGHSIWLNSTYIGSFTGTDALSTYNQTYPLNNTRLTPGAPYVLTIVIDNNSLNENYDIGEDQMKLPRGILDYNLPGHPKTDITWKLTGNLGGEDYRDRARGPLNEGGLYAERNGYHLPDAPTQDWKSSSGPQEGLQGPGIAFYSTTFDLDLPKGYDIPLAFSFANATAAEGTPAAYRAQLFVNGYQFGKYVHNIGPQDVYPVPEGIFNYQGANTVAVSLWVQEKGGAKVEGLELVAGPVVQTGFGRVEAAPQPKWEKREGAY